MERQVTGSTEYLHPTGFLWRRGRVTYLGHLPGHLSSWATDINNRDVAEYADVLLRRGVHPSVRWHVQADHLGCELSGCVLEGRSRQGGTVR
jgi:hypothetical protein